MTWAAWLALGVAVLLLPIGSAGTARTRVLVERGRLSPAGTAPGRSGRTRPAHLVGLGAAGLVVGSSVAVGVVAGPVMALATAIGTATAARLSLRAVRNRVHRREQAELLTALRLLVAELAAGAQPGTAFTAAVEAGPRYAGVFAAAAHACRHGDEPSLDDAALTPLAHAWRVAAVTGAPLAAVVARVADDVAAHVDQARVVTAELAGARSSAGMLAGLPLLGLLLGAAMQARPLHVLTASPTGRLLTLVGVTLDAAGLLWTARLTARAERT